jgi:hypothetical protein
MAKMYISLEESKELEELFKQLPTAYARVIDSLRTNSPHHRLEGEALARFLAEDSKVRDIIRRVKEFKARGDKTAALKKEGMCLWIKSSAA